MKRNESEGTAESAVERTFFGDLDKAAVERLEELYGNSVPEETIARMKELPSSFEFGDSFEESYAEMTGENPPPGVMGFSSGLEVPAHIRIDEFEGVPETTLHERMHQLAHPEAPRLFGRPLYEGVTENLSLSAGEVDVNAELQAYPNETREARRISDLCGEGAVEKAYFEGDDSDLLECVDQAQERSFFEAQTEDKEVIDG